MKKQLQQELMALAMRIVQKTEGKEVSVGSLKDQTRRLYEKLSILEFVELGMATIQPENELQEIEEKQYSQKQELQPRSPQDQNSEHQTPDGTQYSQQEAITEPNTEKIKDIVAQMPPESDQIDQMLNNIFPKTKKSKTKEDDKLKKDSSKTEKQEEEFGVHFDSLPLFEPISTKEKDNDRPKSVNDRLKGAIHIGLNDRHAFVKHLFGGSASDYNRVLSQLNTQKSKEEALNFLENMVKPDYNNWEGKELYENRFLSIIEKRFD